MYLMFRYASPRIVRDKRKEDLFEVGLLESDAAHTLNKESEIKTSNVTLLATK